MYLACQPFNRSPSHTKRYGQSVLQRSARIARYAQARRETKDEDPASKFIVWRGKDRDGRDIEVTRGYFGLAHRLHVWVLRGANLNAQSPEWHLVGDNMSQLPALRIPRD
jgi:hypothetical protein